MGIYLKTKLTINPQQKKIPFTLLFFKFASQKRLIRL